MCDYSLHHVSSRPAKVADKLVTMELAKAHVRGFAAVGELGPKLVIHDSPPEVAVCLLPGTELAFDENVQYERPISFLGLKFSGKARWITRSRASGRLMRITCTFSMTRWNSPTARF